jgi:uncharacterized protein with PIN domain
LASTAGFNEMTETWCVLDLDTPVVRRNATLYGRLVEYEEPSQAIAHFAEIGKRSHVSRIRRCEGIEDADPPSDARIVPNPNFGTVGCSWELICAADGLPLPAIEPLLRSVSPSSVVCVALRWQRQGVRIHDNAIEGGRYVSALLLKFSRVPTSSLPEELLELLEVVAEHHRVSLKAEVCIECGVKFAWYDRRAPDSTSGLGVTFCPTRGELVQESDLEEWDFFGCHQTWEDAKAKYWSNGEQPWALRLDGHFAGLLMGKASMPESWKSHLGGTMCWACVRALDDRFEHIWSH